MAPAGDDPPKLFDNSKKRKNEANLSHGINEMVGCGPGLPAPHRKRCSVLIIEHNLEVIRGAGWIINLGPEGGNHGGSIVAQGTPEQVTQAPATPATATGPGSASRKNQVVVCWLSRQIELRSR